jgi:hypothetical protein
MYHLAAEHLSKVSTLGGIAEPLWASASMTEMGQYAKNSS